MLYDLTELQRDANKLYQMSAKETLSAMQRLYEEHKALTYPRTDSRYLTEDLVPTLPDRVRAVSRGDFAPFAAEILGERRPIAKACVNNAKVSDHHAIIPTEQAVDTARLPLAEKRIYLLVVRRFLACFYPAYRYRRIRAELLAEGETFYAAGRVVLDAGWRRVQEGRDEDEVDEQAIPPFQKGDTFPCRRCSSRAWRTSPPVRYTEATLLSAMENPSQYIEDKAMREYIGGGLGTPATRRTSSRSCFPPSMWRKKGPPSFPPPRGCSSSISSPPISRSRS